MSKEIADNDLESVSDRQIQGFTEALDCESILALEIWRKLHLDINEGPHELASLRSVVKQYKAMIDMTEDIISKVNALPNQEKDRSGNWDGEPSHFVLGIEYANAYQLAEKFKQNAFLWCGADAIPKLILMR